MPGSEDRGDPADAADAADDHRGHDERGEDQARTTTVGTPELGTATWSASVFDWFMQPPPNELIAAQAAKIMAIHFQLPPMFP